MYLLLKAYSHNKITSMANAKKMLSLLSYCIVYLRCHLGNNSKLDDAEVSILYNDAAFNDYFKLSPVPPF